MKTACETLAKCLTRMLWAMETILFLLLALLNLRYFSIIRPSSCGNELVEFQNDSVLRFLPVFFLGIAAVWLCVRLAGLTDTPLGGGGILQ